MNEAILKKLEARLDRRTFLRGSALAAATLVGMAAASPVIAFAQGAEPPSDDKKKSDEKRDEKKDRDEPKDGDKPYRVERDGKFYDRDGVEVRECPECGHNQYQQGRTWTCENCGYSYVE